MPHFINLLIVLGIVTVFIVLPYMYQMVKWHSKDPVSWARFEFDNRVKPEDLRFRTLTSNLIIGNREMPYPVFRDLPHLDSSFQKWMTQLPVENDAKQAWHGKVDLIRIPSARRKIFTVSVFALYMTGLFLVPICINVLNPSFTNRAAIAIVAVITMGGYFLHGHYYNVWSASGEGLIVGQWFFKAFVPWPDISELELGFAKGNRSELRRATFMIHLRHKDRTIEISSGRFKSIFLLFRSIMAFRPDLKASGDTHLADNSSSD